MVGSSEEELHPPPVRGCVWASYGELDGGAILGTFSVARAPAMRRMCAWRKLGLRDHGDEQGCGDRGGREGKIKFSLR